MTDDLERAVSAYRRADKARDDRRRTLAAAMRDATDAGVPQRRICELTGWTREYVRKLVAEAREQS